jgi:lysozyme
MIRRWEGFRSTWEADMVGVETIGFGTTRRLLSALQLADVEGPISKTEGQALLEATIVQHFAPKLDRSLPSFLMQHTRDALVSFVYNVGLSAFENSTMHKLYKAGKADEAADEFMRWVHVTNPETGTVRAVDGLQKRRREEMRLARDGVVPWDEETDHGLEVPPPPEHDATKVPVAEHAYAPPGEIDVPSHIDAQAAA